MSLPQIKKGIKTNYKYKDREETQESNHSNIPVLYNLNPRFIPF